MIDNYITGSSGFIGQHLIKKLDGKSMGIEHGRMAYDDCKNLFFLSTYGNMAHHDDHMMMVSANVADILWWLGSGLVKDWLCYMSSSSVILPVQTPYSCTKRAAENILEALPELKSCIVRPYSVTGVGEQKEHLIPTLIRSCMEGEEMPFDPFPVHDFVDVEDVVDRLIKLADEEKTGIYEFGQGIPVTNQEVKQIVERTCGKKANVKIVRHIRPYDSTAWYCQRTNFNPWKPLKKSIEEMVEAYRAK
jgi:nucleoside-diphosphate-sugar epimerase